MDVTQLPSWTVTDCSLGARQDVRPLIDRVITTARDSITAGVPPLLAAPAGGDNDVAPALGNRMTPDQARRELELLKQRAEGGDPTSARRVAELYDLVEDADTAAIWWRFAADLGDPDAEDYVREILNS